MSARTGLPDPPGDTINWALRALGRRKLIRLEALGRGSTALHVLHIEIGTAREAEFVLRRYVDEQRLASDPWYVPAHEATALRHVESAGLPVPRLVAADPGARDCDVPTLLMSRLSGHAGDGGTHHGSRHLRQLAAALAGIHAIDVSVAPLPDYRPYYAAGDIDVPDWSSGPEVWRRALRILDRRPAPATPPVFVHRDYHPGNTLWHDGELTGIVDWTTACHGPAGIDLARMRQSLARAGGPATADAFLRAYVSASGRDLDHHPWWDVVDAVDLLVDTPAPGNHAELQQLRRWERYVARAVAEL